jgi:hypothetical protein
MLKNNKIKWAGGITIIVAIVFLVSSKDTPSATPTSPPIKITADVPVAPATQQNLTNVITTLLQQNSSQFSYNNITIDSDASDKFYTRPTGAKQLFIDINTTDGFWDDASFVTGTGKFASNIFQQVFPIDPTFYEVNIRYYGTTTDQYGNSKNDMVMQYNMDRPLYGKINWGGFADTENDIHLCAFLREDFNTMSEKDKSNSFVGCLIAVSNLRTAESAIETSNPQFSDIPQYK